MKPAPHSRIYAGKRVLVTGAGGFIGGHLISTLIEQWASVTALDRSPLKLSNPHFAELIGDVRDVAFMEYCLSKIKPEVIFHLAAYKERSSELKSFREALDVNLIGTLNLLTVAQRIKCLQSIVTLGTGEEYGQNKSPFIEGTREAPVNAYSFSKFCVTQLCEAAYSLYGLPCVVLRPTLAYGPGQMDDMFLPTLIQAIIANQHFPMTLGEQIRDYIYVTDLVDAMLLAGGNKKAGGQVINLGSGNSTTIANLALKVERMLGREGLIMLGALPYRPNEVMEYTVDFSKARNLLGWRAKVDFEHGLWQTIDYYKRVN